MNWPRVWIGAALASAVLWVCDFVRYMFAPWSEPLSLPRLATLPAFLLLPDLLIGFWLSWLYVFARPRLGPGPKTALFMATIGFALHYALLLNPAVWMEEPAAAASGVALGWLSFAAATYLAGWQYVEKPPE